eukprot:11604429-Karenia_brevis.AAC.1
MRRAGVGALEADSEEEVPMPRRRIVLVDSRASQDTTPMAVERHPTEQRDASRTRRLVLEAANLVHGLASR